MVDEYSTDAEIRAWQQDYHRYLLAEQAIPDLYPGAVGEFLVNEIRSYRELGQVLGERALIRRVVDEILVAEKTR